MFMLIFYYGFVFLSNWRVFSVFSCFQPLRALLEREGGRFAAFGVFFGLFLAFGVFFGPIFEKTPVFGFREDGRSQRLGL